MDFQVDSTHSGSWGPGVCLESEQRRLSLGEDNRSVPKAITLARCVNN